MMGRNLFGVPPAFARGQMRQAMTENSLQMMATGQPPSFAQMQGAWEQQRPHDMNNMQRQQMMRRRVTSGGF